MVCDPRCSFEGGQKRIQPGNVWVEGGSTTLPGWATVGGNMETPTAIRQTVARSRAAVKCAPVRPKVLGGLGLDTVEFLADSELSGSAHASLGSLVTQLKSGRKIGACADFPDISPSIVGASWKGGMFPGFVSTPAWRLFFNLEDHLFRLILNAEYLAAAAPEEILAELSRLSSALFSAVALSESEGMPWRVSRLDIRADYEGITPAQYVDTTHVVRRSRRLSTYADVPEDAHFRGRKVTGLSFGTASSRTQVVIYDKVEQARMKRSEWTLSSLRDRGWDGVAPVMRVEVRLRARALDEFPELKLRDPRTVFGAGDWVSQVWAYATTATVRYCEPSLSRKVERWRTREDWMVIQGTAGEAPCAMRRRGVVASTRLERVVRASRRLVSSAASLLAERPESYAAAAQAVQGARLEGRPILATLLATICALSGDWIGSAAYGVVGSEALADRVQEELAERYGRVVAYEAQLGALSTADRWDSAVSPLAVSTHYGLQADGSAAYGPKVVGDVTRSGFVSSVGTMPLD